MNSRAEETVERIMRLFLEGGVAPLDLYTFALVDAQVRIIIGRTMETDEEKKARKWANYQRVRKETAA